MHNDPIIGLIFISVLIVLIYSIGLWAGRNLERSIEQDKLIAKRLAEEDKKNKKRRR
tara:strand:- start:508 stop:678 length:171 start_codon:yes stop_codon:yes gene_type:complete